MKNTEKSVEQDNEKFELYVVISATCKDNK